MSLLAAGAKAGIPPIVISTPSLLSGSSEPHCSIEAPPHLFAPCNPKYANMQPNTSVRGERDGSMFRESAWLLPHEGMMLVNPILGDVSVGALWRVL